MVVPEILGRERRESDLLLPATGVPRFADAEAVHVTTDMFATFAEEGRR